MRIAQKPTYSFLILFLALVAINSLAARYLAFPSPFGPGEVTTVYPAVAIMILFALWFGGYGAIAAYFGCFIGAGILADIPIPVALYWSFADLWQVLIPLVAFRMLRADISLRSRRDLVLAVIFAVLINNAFGAAWGAVTLAIGNVIAWTEVSALFAGWFFWNVVICAFLLLPALFYLTPVVRKSRLFVRQYWN